LGKKNRWQRVEVDEEEPGQASAAALNQSSSGDYARVVGARRALEQLHPVRQLFTLHPQRVKVG